MNKNETTIFTAGFESGATIHKGESRIYRISPCTHWDDVCERMIVRDGVAIVQIEHRPTEGCRSFSTDEWTDRVNLGEYAALRVVEDCPRGCQCECCA